MIRLVRDCGYRWRDMVVMVGNLEEYDSLITTVFQDYEIPFFLDQERSAIFHPLLEFIRSSLEVITKGWRYDALLRCFKTGFLFPLTTEEKVHQEWRKKVSRLENYILAFGIQGKRWLDDNSWTYSLQDRLEEELEDRKVDIRAGKMLFYINETRLYGSSGCLPK